MPTVQIALYILLGVALLVSAITDLRSRLIYDVITYPTALAGLVLREAMVGWKGQGPTSAFGLLPGLWGLAIGLLVFLPWGWFGGMGGGDIKLMAAVGAVLGFPVILYAIMFTSLVGGLQAILVELWDGSLWTTLANTFRLVAHALRIKRLGDDEDRPKKYVPYGVAIALGTVWAVIWDVTHPQWMPGAGVGG